MRKLNHIHEKTRGFWFAASLSYYIFSRMHSDTTFAIGLIPTQLMQCVKQS